MGSVRDDVVLMSIMVTLLGIVRSLAVQTSLAINARLLRLIRASFLASHGIYGAPRVFLDLSEAGETCSKHRIAPAKASPPRT